MLVIIPQAKEMDMAPVMIQEATTLPVFQMEAEFLAGLMRNLSVHEIAEKMQISEEEATVMFEEFQKFDDLSVAPKAALFAFTDTFYNALNPKVYSPADLHYAQVHLRIMSALYGVLRPFDLIKAYRMVFDLRLRDLGAEDVLDYWKDLITQQLMKDANDAGGEVLYLGIDSSLKDIAIKALQEKYKVVNAEFKDWRDDEWKDIHSFSDPATAELANYVIKNKIQKLTDLKSWSWKGYKFNSDLSDDSNYMYTRTTADE
ncbi:MAG: peroxide stress protein YaaA [Bacteroidales bacterium]